MGYWRDSYVQSGVDQVLWGSVELSGSWYLRSIQVRPLVVTLLSENLSVRQARLLSVVHHKHPVR